MNRRIWWSLKEWLRRRRWETMTVRERLTVAMMERANAPRWAI